MKLYSQVEKIILKRKATIVLIKKQEEKIKKKLEEINLKNKMKEEKIREKQQLVQRRKKPLKKVKSHSALIGAMICVVEGLQLCCTCFLT